MCFRHSLTENSYICNQIAIEVIWQKPFIQYSTMTLKEESGQYRHLLKGEYILTSGDGVRFVVSNQWEKGNVLYLLQIAKNEGWKYEIIKNERI